MVLPGDGGETLLELIPEARREILIALKKAGPLPVEAIADALDITVSGARQHLSGLQRDGVVTYQRVREGPGRPRHFYELTDTGDALFARNYAVLAGELLGYVQDADPALLDAVFARRRERRTREARARLRSLGSLEEKVRALAGLLEEEGYMPQVEPVGEGGFLLVERNCLVEALAVGYGGACDSEIALIREALPGTEVRRVAHVLDDQPCCAYEILPVPPEQAIGPGVDT
ncbi:MAG: helix-turn-helix domain-containing protein [Gemmatimonadota bacterium]|jgi:predicted ArsR family transcriptional regulator